MSETLTPTFPHLLAAVTDYAQRFEAMYKDRLLGHDRLASGDLLNSIHARVVAQGVTIAVDVDLAKHWQYVEWDTRPHWPPPDALLRWITVKPVIPRPDSRGRIPTPRQLAFLIGRKIAQKGTKGTHDLYDTVEQLNTDYEEIFARAIAEDVGDMADVMLRSFADTHTRD